MNIIKIPNYLNEINEEHGKSICVNVGGEIIRPIISELEPKLSLEKIAQKLNISSRLLYYWVKGERPVPLSKLWKLLKLWKILCKKTDKNFVKVWNIFYMEAKNFGVNSGKTVTLPKIIDNDFAYLLGYIYADGCLSNPTIRKKYYNGLRYVIQITDENKEFLENTIKPLCKKLFDIEPKIYHSEPNVWNLVIDSKPIHTFFHKVMKTPIGTKINLKIKNIPFRFNSNNALIREFISGFFDGDGTIFKTRRGQIIIDICQKEKYILE